MEVKKNYDLYLKIGRSYNNKVNNDLIEKNILKILKEKFDNDIVQSSQEFSKYDFMSDKYLCELKTRNNNMNKYNYTMINKHKICKTNKTIIFLFNFLDFLTYYIYNDDDLKNGITYFDNGYRKDRGFNEVSTMLYIPINLLTILKVY